MNDGGFWEKFDKFRTWAERFQFLWGLLSVPAIYGALTAVAACYDHYPVALIMMCAVISFSFLSSGLLRFQQWRAYNAVKGKFEIVNPIINVDCVWDAKGKPRWINDMNGGVSCMNRSNFTLKYRYTQFQVIIEGRVANDKKLVGKISESISMSQLVTHPDRISLTDLKKLDAKGTVEVTVEYGTGSVLRYKAHKKIEFEATVKKADSSKPNVAIGFAGQEIN